jgi:hypothetical protein
VILCAVEGSVDVLIKAAAGYELVGLVSHEPDVEEILLAYYRRGRPMLLHDVCTRPSGTTGRASWAGGLAVMAALEVAVYPASGSGRRR